MFNICKKYKKHGVECPKTLLILGNGFDLRCNLNSTLRYFFSLKFQNNLSNYKNINNFKYFMTTNINEYFWHENSHEINDLIVHGITKMLSILHIIDDGKHSCLYAYIHYLMATFMSFHYQMFGSEEDYSKNKIQGNTFTKSELFHLLIYVYFLKKYSGDELLNKLPQPDDKSRFKLIECFLEIFFTSHKHFRKFHTYKLDNNFWMFYFGFMLSLESLNYDRHISITWSDIEDHLFDFLTKYSKQVYKYLCYIIKYISPLSYDDMKLNDCGNNIILGNKLFREFYLGDKDEFFKLNIFTIFLILNGIYNNTSLEWDISNRSTESYYYNFLYKELYSFEEMFSEYIRKLLISSNIPLNGKSYNKIAPVIINSLLPHKNKPFNLISFNYVPINKSLINTYDGNDLIKGNNIHSTISTYKNGHPIFGISEDNCEQNNVIQPYIIFSKSYRVDKDRRNRALPKKVYQIVFYGHSFGFIDFPYFKFIFNKYNILKNNIKLIFCYSVHHNGKTLLKGDTEYLLYKKECHDEQVNGTKYLISEYNKYLNSQDIKYNHLYRILSKRHQIVYHCIDDNY